MDEATKRWEEGALACLRGVPFDHRKSASWDLGYTAGYMWTRRKDDNRLAALWLEHRASELEAEAEELQEKGDHEGAMKLADAADARRDSALDIRVRLLGEEAEGG